MKLQLSAALLGLAATAVLAQEHQSGPFTLHVKGTNPSSTIDGYGGSCHAGAAISGLCYSEGEPAGVSNSFTYRFNYTGFNQAGDDEVGTLVWGQPYTDENGNPAEVSQAMGLVYQPTSNVAAPLFGFSPDVFLVGFNSEGELFGYNYVDDSKFAPGQPPTDYTGKAYYQWAVCWQYFTGYFYQSVAWVQIGAPHNPTCEPVEITKVDI
ncbi:hypothetical protein SAMD00023353_1200570 [Rosellinia necatrix]|uniref:DUF7907 domain-containing protein n=1 Tax=Rosellinia necatrix TaxID=77044 RepID=A0A1W2TLN9_ROSNE|nr:hypothetical protein SAMD00023353_1200570 [Rosellinia necatrix]